MCEGAHHCGVCDGRVDERVRVCSTEYVRQFVKMYESLCGQIVCGQLVCGQLVCGQLVCGQLVCGQLVCGQLVCGQLVCVVS